MRVSPAAPLVCFGLSRVRAGHDALALSPAVSGFFRHPAHSSVPGCPCPTSHHTALLLVLCLSWPLGATLMSSEVRVRSGTGRDGGLMAPSPRSQHACVNGPLSMALGTWKLPYLDQHVVLWRKRQVGCLGLLPTALGWSWSTEISMSLLRHHL